MRRLSDHLQYDFFAGLPSAAFDAFLLFYPTAHSLRRRPGFPNFSWSGWSGYCRFAYVNQENEWNGSRACRYPRNLVG
jgi:hypothetical protein